MDVVLNIEAEKLLRDRFKALSGERLAVSLARRAIGKGKKSGGRSNRVGEGDVVKDKPLWAKGWVYISETNQYYSPSTGVVLDVAGFRGLFDSELPEEGLNASGWVLNNCILPKVDRRMYMPGAGALFQMEGVHYVNTYSNRGAVVLGNSVVGAQERLVGAAGAFKRHLELLIGGGEWTREAQLFANFLRYRVEHPDRRITWAVLLQGAYGDGKSEPVTRLMQKLLGRVNVRVIQAQTIEGSGFNGWAEGNIFSVIEEIKLHGHNRYDILNRLKSIITNNVIEIHRKNVDPYTSPNVCVYYITTNYKDALPIVAEDRRYFVLFSRFPKRYINDMGYFGKLFEAIDSDAGARAIGEWLLSVGYHEDFKPQGHAPDTSDKEQAADLSRDSILDDIEKELDESDSPMFCDDYVIYAPFRNYLRYKGISNDKGYLSDKMLFKYLGDLGFQSIGRHVVDGHRERIWTKKVDLQIFTSSFEMRKLVC